MKEWLSIIMISEVRALSARAFLPANHGSCPLRRLLMNRKAGKRTRGADQIRHCGRMCTGPGFLGLAFCGSYTKDVE